MKKENLYKKVSTGHHLVYFYGDWCAPCRSTGPMIDELSKTTSVIKVNVDEFPLTAGEFAVRTVPALIAFRDGQVTGQMLGIPSIKRLNELLSK